MNERDRVRQGLSELPLLAPSADLSKKLRVLAHARLVPQRVHLAWSVAVAASVVVYLGWALLYTSQLY
jgi:hypothetical protein